MSKPTPVKLGDLEEALMFVSSGEAFGNMAWVCRATGHVLWHSDEFTEFGPLPKDIHDGKRYVALPHQRELDIGSPQPLEFTRQHLPACVEQVREIFSRRGAYARFKDLLHRHDCLAAWHRWEEEQTRQALRAWCEENDITLAD